MVNSTRDTLDDLGIRTNDLIESLLEGVIITDVRGTIQFVNTTFCDVTGYSADEVLGKNPRLLQSGKHAPLFYKEMWNSLLRTGRWQGEICNRRKNGELYTEWLTLTCLRNNVGRVTHYVGVFSDISERKHAEEEIWHRAHHDLLTGLPNRSLFLVHLEQALVKARRDRTTLAVLFVDLDRVKQVNDTLGHGAGDQLLQEVAHRLRSTLREVDVAARFGGDEFVLFLPDLRRYKDIFKIADKVLHVLREPISAEGHTVNVSASIGISIYPDDGVDVHTLIDHADRAMYEAKREGRDRFKMFLPVSRTGLASRFDRFMRRWARLRKESLDPPRRV